MLSVDLTSFFLRILSASLQSVLALAAVLLLLAAVFVSRILVGKAARWCPTARVLLTLSALALLVYNFYNTVIEVPENLELLSIAKEYPDDADCGKASTGFIAGGIGLLNPCKQGCYRGITLRRLIRAKGIPPSPEYNREFQCWVRKNPSKDIIPDKYKELIR